MDSALTVSSLTLKLGSSSIFSNISFSIFPGEFALLLGKNGAGKTSLLNCISSVTQASSGEIKKSSIGYIGNPSGLYESLTVEEHIKIFYEERSHTIFDYLKSAHMSSVSSKKVSTLSKGELAHCLLSIEVAKKPHLLLLDEVTSNLDSEGVAYWGNEIKRAVHGYGMSVLFATHDIQRVSPFATKVLVLEDGSIQEVLLEHVHSSYIRTQR